MDEHICAILYGRPWVAPGSLSDLSAPAPGSLRISLAPDGEGKVEEGSGEGLYKVLRMCSLSALPSETEHQHRVNILECHGNQALQIAGNDRFTAASLYVLSIGLPSR